MNRYELGLAAEHRVTAKLLEGGRHIARPLNPQAKYDLLLWDWQYVKMQDNTHYMMQAWCRVQVKRAYSTGQGWRVDLRSWSGRKNRQLYDHDDFEYLAVVCDTDVYMIPWKVVSKNKTGFTITHEHSDYRLV